MKNISIFSFFTGVGFLDLGFEGENFDVQFVNEYIPSFLEAYKHARAKMGINAPKYGYHLGSAEEFITEPLRAKLRNMVTETKKAGDIVGFIAGPPCPDFSVAGKNKGKYGERGKLSGIYFQMITEQNPDFFLFENVKGLWRTAKHRAFFEELKKKAQENGYITTERLINAIEYGAPQNRERIILLGFKSELLKEIGIKFDSSSLSEREFSWTKFAKYNKEEVFNMPWSKTNPQGTKVVKPKGIPEELTVEYWFKKNDVDNHPNAQHRFQPKAGLAKFKVIEEGDDLKKSYKRLHRWRYSPTCAYGNNEVHIHPYLPRRISAAEALSLQSLPKEFELPSNITLTDMFKIIGNGVPYLAAKSIAKTIFDFLGGSK